ncbi:TIGR03618 family F420-dependent PPOX class oxidoreductase [Microbacterium indicum]|uniref:TIGR03618 family F420-dependent PPOX class oxidoreductase n=1 Tax=Microbacterium indicum TaxID=358100 RepID=UPI00040988A6|nr:TIGR03618 family F420-dependent PPOX class oxidoreductase [Microbacterium indicum]
MPKTPWAEAARLFETPAVVHLATIAPDGSPRSVPVWMDRFGDDDLAFFTSATSRKARHIAADPRVAVSLTDPANPLAHVTVAGEVVERIEGDRALEIVDGISDTYTGGPYPMREGFVVFVIRPKSWTA